MNREEVVRPERETAVTHIRHFWKQNAVYGLVGGVSGFLVHYPLILILLMWAVRVSAANDYNTNTDGFMAGFFCWLPAAGLGFVLGMACGTLGRRVSIWLGGAAAVAAGILASLLLLGPMTWMILQDWAGG